MKKLILIICFLSVIAITVNAQQKEFPKLTGPYLGQKPPGLMPEIFVPEVLTSGGFGVHSARFSPDGMEFYYYRYSRDRSSAPQIMFTKVEDDRWSEPAPLKLATEHSALQPLRLHITADNRWLLLECNKGGVFKIYASERKDEGWSEPAYAGNGMYMTSDSLGHLYTTDISEQALNGHYYLTEVSFSNGILNGNAKLRIEPNYGKQAHPCIARDGSYILFDTNGQHLFVSFKKGNGSWGEAVDLTRHGFKPEAGTAYISPDGKFLFFHYDHVIWWVDIRVIENLRPKE